MSRYVVKQKFCAECGMPQNPMVSCPSPLMVPHELFVQHLLVVPNNNIITVAFAKYFFLFPQKSVTLQTTCVDDDVGVNAFNDDDDDDVGVAPPLRSP